VGGGIDWNVKNKHLPAQIPPLLLAVDRLRFLHFCVILQSVSAKHFSLFVGNGGAGYSSISSTNNNKNKNI